MNFLATLKQKRLYAVKIFFVIFYTVGIAGLLWNQTHDIFIKLTPLALILSSITLIFYHGADRNIKAAIIFFVIFLTGFFIEVIGVNTGIIFGEYSYGEGLGKKIFNTPILIGVNWLLLIYATSNLFQKLNLSPFLLPFAGASFMVIYDIFLEPVAPKIDLWSWASEVVPLQNYIAWFSIALIFHSFISIFKIKIYNPMATTILICQFSFFTILNLTI